MRLAPRIPNSCTSYTEQLHLVYRTAAPRIPNFLGLLFSASRRNCKMFCLCVGGGFFDGHEVTVKCGFEVANGFKVGKGSF